MPLHDWTRVDAGVYHGFHTRWIVHLQEQLNDGLLPKGYYADAEQVVRPVVADLLTLREPATLFDPPANGPAGVAVLDAPPHVRRRLTMRPAPPPAARQRRLTVRHVSGDRVVAVVEIVSPANKDRAESVTAFAAKVNAALDSGVHVLVLDPFPPGPHDPFGMHGAVAAARDEPPVEPPAGEPVAFASYGVGDEIEVDLEYLAVGRSLPPMPLFLAPGRYVTVPLEPSYTLAWNGTPERWRAVVAGE